VLRAYAAGQISYSDLLARRSGRSWDRIEHQARVLRLRLRHRQVDYGMLSDERDIVPQGDYPGVEATRENLSYFCNSDY
jgi:hypothetical protein